MADPKMTPAIIGYLSIMFDMTLAIWHSMHDYDFVEENLALAYYTYLNVSTEYGTHYVRALELLP